MDTVSIRGVFTVEANQEAEEIINGISYIVDQECRNSRTIGNEGVQSIYSLTL